ncbi:MAG: geranylgeranylglycerol-phosphate geranylgeranyltransferase [Candidatus Jordarchaeum sp.]|uniref:geranylgeranylglycerol-phosphate geranylgeranyltransferase n=1 Tax=Candidatus Jordarchaeum sp. TaxID=2823881 RepID=UPI00404A3E4B
MGLKAYLEIIRPVNGFMGALTVLSAVQVANVFYNLNLQFFWAKFWIFPHRFFEIVFISFFVYFFIASAGMVINDIFDLEVDKINKPNRPLPREALTVKRAWIYTFVLWSLGISLAFLISLASGILALIFSGIGLLYAARVKVLGILGNLVVAFSFAFGYFYGSLITSLERGIWGIPLMTWLFFVTAFMVLQGREVIKGMEDIEGDKLREVKTIARVYGLKRASIIGASCNFIGIISFTLCWIIDLFSPLWDPKLLGFWFIPFYLLGVAAVALSSILIIWKYDSLKAQKRSSLFDKIGALFGLIAFLIGPYTVENVGITIWLWILI